MGKYMWYHVCNACGGIALCPGFYVHVPVPDLDTIAYLHVHVHVQCSYAVPSYFDNYTWCVKQLRLCGLAVKAPV